MFGWLRGKMQKDLEFKESMMTVAEEDSRAKVNRAIGSVGFQFTYKSINLSCCIKAYWQLFKSR